MQFTRKIRFYKPHLGTIPIVAFGAMYTRFVLSICEIALLRNRGKIATLDSSRVVADFTRRTRTNLFHPIFEATNLESEKIRNRLSTFIKWGVGVSGATAPYLTGFINLCLPSFIACGLWFESLAPHIT